MKLGLIGCGKVGTTIFYLLKNHHKIVGVYDIKKEDENRARRALGLRSNIPYRDLVAQSEVLFLATPDDKIMAAYRRAKPLIEGEKFIFHFSGLLPARIFPKSKNIHRGSIHPFATFPRLVIPPPRKRYFLFVEGDKRARVIAGQIFKRRYFILTKLNERYKKDYHLIGVLSSNLIVGLISAARKLARKIAWKDEDFYKIVIPIIDETLKNIKRYKLDNALSGPLVRGDIGVIKKHLQALKSDKTLLNIYKAISLNILKDTPKGKSKKALEKMLKGC